MRVITNERRLRRGRFLSTSLSISGILMLLSSWAGVVFFTQAVGYSTFPLLIAGMIFSLVGIHFTRKWVRLPLAHTTLASTLKGISKDSVLINYYGPSDHILITKEGAFTLTARKPPFDLMITGDKWVDQAPLRERLQRALAQDTIGSPIREAKHDANHTSKWLRKMLDRDIEAQPLIVFLNPKTHLEVIEQSQVPVTYADKRTPALKTFLKSDSIHTLTTEEIERIVSLVEIA